MTEQSPEDFKKQLNQQIKHERFMANAAMGHEAKEAIDPTDGDHRGLGKHKPD
jgi:hypothetical protein